MQIFHADSDDIENPLRGGQPVRTFEINRRLARSHQVQVFTASYPGHRRQRVREGIRYTSLGFGFPQFGLSYHLAFLAALGPRLLGARPDIVVEEFNPPVGFCLLPLWTSRPVVSMVQWYFFRDWEKRYKLPLERTMKAIARRVEYRHFIVQSRRMGQVFKQLIPQAAISHIPCGISEESLQRQGASGEYALFLGRLDTSQKGLDTLVAAWEGLARAGSRIPLRVAGAGPASAWLQDRVRAAGLGDCVSLLGRVEGAEKKALLAGCRFLVMPSREETFGLTALEAMAVSRPVVTFDIDHLNEVVLPDCGVLVRPGDTDSFARAVRDLWADPGRGTAMGMQGFERARTFLWDRLAVQQESLYQEIAKEKVRA